MKMFDRIRTSADSWYLPLMLSVWCFAPGVRRLIDWQIGHSKFNFVSITPMLVLLPLIVYLWRNSKSERIRMPLKTLAFLWLFGFIYAFVVAFASGTRAGAVYDFANFCLPMAVATWLIVRPSSRSQAFNQISITLLWIGIVESLYGLYQFVSPPPWDVYYVNNTNQVSLGDPVPFGLHPFAMLNGHGTLAMFLVIAILFNMHRFDLRRPLPLLAATLFVAVLILTTVRSAYLALAIGTIVYVVLSPQRSKALFGLGLVGMISVILLLNASTLLGNATITTQLQARIGTLGNTDQDPSVNGRKEETAFALHQGLAEPLGQGLGIVGQGVNLESQSDSKVSQIVLDNGYVARFLEMGIPGAIFYLAAIIFGIICGFRAYRVALATDSVSLGQIAVASLSIQVTLMGLDLSSDFHSSLAGVFFWIALGLALRPELGDERLKPEWAQIDRTLPSRKGPLWV